MDPRSFATATERKLARRDAFAAAEGSPFAPPRLRLGKLLIDLHERGDPAGRAALLQVFTEATSTARSINVDFRGGVESVSRRKGGVAPSGRESAR